MGWYARVTIPHENSEIEAVTDGQMKIIPDANYPEDMCNIIFQSEGKEYSLTECNGADKLCGVVMRCSTIEETDAFQKEGKRLFGKQFKFRESSN